MEKILNKFKNLQKKLKIVCLLLFANKAYLFICHNADIKSRAGDEIDIGNVHMSCEPGNIEFDTRRRLYYTLIEHLEIRNAKKY